MLEEVDVLVLGAGLTGLAAGSVLGDRALVLEKEARPGGLVRTERFGDYWFDHVLHLLYFEDATTEARVRDLVGDALEPCTPEAWVETRAGTVRFPLQMHLGGLDPEAVVDCIGDLVAAASLPPEPPPSTYEEMLLRSFGRSFCDLFFFPYNRKMWKRPLAELAPSGFQWNITRPDLDGVLRGALAADRRFSAYNSRGWYPRPPRGASMRGMEVLARALAGRVPRLQLQSAVEAIDLETRTVTARQHGATESYRYRQACLSTLPLPFTVSCCRQAPEDLRAACRRLVRNRVLSAAFSVRGPRPEERGHWRYYADESLVFTRLVYPHVFDPGCVPEDGWAILAEITERAEEPAGEPGAILERARDDMRRAGALPPACEIVDAHLLVVDPAYVVFSVENEAVIRAARDFLVRHGVTPLGRYGRWEYSSMAQVMRDGFVWAEGVVPRRAAATPSSTSSATTSRQA
jgi:protoporphyrinogen oxidase